MLIWKTEKKWTRFEKLHLRNKKKGILTKVFRGLHPQTLAVARSVNLIARYSGSARNQSLGIQGTFGKSLVRLLVRWNGKLNLASIFHDIFIVSNTFFETWLTTLPIILDGNIFFKNPTQELLLMVRWR